MSLKKSNLKIRISSVFIAAAMLLCGCSSQQESVTESSDLQGVSSSQSDVPESFEQGGNNENSSDNDSSITENSSADGSSITENSTDDETDKTENSTDDESTSSKSTPKAQEDNSKPEESKDEHTDFTVKWTVSNEWQDAGKYCGGIEVSVINNSDKVESWTAKVAVPDNTEVLSGWNGIFSVSGNTMTIKNESYNGTIEKGGSVSFGFNYSSSQKLDIKDITINGSAAKPEENEGDNGNQGNNSQPQSTTTVKPLETPPAAPDDPEGTTPVSQHGALSVNGSQLVDKNGKSYQLRGMSTHGIGWFPDFVNEAAFKTLRDDWNTNVIRLAMYTGRSEGYDGAGGNYEKLMYKGIDIAIKLDMYVIVDWHVLADQSPTVMQDDALRFFDEVSKRYAGYDNIIYEICNEPNGYATWDGHIKPYAERVIPVIRKNDPDSVIIVGTPTWSQDIDKALANPLEYDNIMYALHFYAATHTDWLRQRLSSCVSQGLPVMVTEFGCCDASGNGANDFNQTTAWLELLDSLGISYMNWNLANKNESSSAFRPGASAYGNWSESDLSESGKWMRNWFKNH